MPRKGYRNKLGFRRKSHKKLRLGCATCKRRRIKCLEELPQCEECVKLGEHCDYLDYTPHQLDRLRRAKLQQGSELDDDDKTRSHAVKWQATPNNHAIPTNSVTTIANAVAPPRQAYEDIPYPEFHDILGFGDMSLMMPLTALPPGQLPLPAYNSTLPLAASAIPGTIPPLGPMGGTTYSSYYEFDPQQPLPQLLPPHSLPQPLPLASTLPPHTLSNSNETSHEAPTNSIPPPTQMAPPMPLMAPSMAQPPPIAHDPLKCTILDCYLCHHQYPPT